MNVSRLLTAGGGLTLAPLLFAASQDPAPTIDEVERAGALFASSCATCHLPPDPDHATDRAWLRQVTDTA